MVAGSEWRRARSEQEERVVDVACRVLSLARTSPDATAVAKLLTNATQVIPRNLHVNLYNHCGCAFYDGFGDAAVLAEPCRMLTDNIFGGSDDTRLQALAFASTIHSSLMYCLTSGSSTPLDLEGVATAADAQAEVAQLQAVCSTCTALQLLTIALMQHPAWCRNMLAAITAISSQRPKHGSTLSTPSLETFIDAHHLRDDFPFDGAGLAAAAAAWQVHHGGAARTAGARWAPAPMRVAASMYMAAPTAPMRVVLHLGAARGSEASGVTCFCSTARIDSCKLRP